MTREVIGPQGTARSVRPKVINSSSTYRDAGELTTIFRRGVPLPPVARTLAEVHNEFIAWGCEKPPFEVDCRVRIPEPSP